MFIFLFANHLPEVISHKIPHRRSIVNRWHRKQEDCQLVAAVTQSLGGRESGRFASESVCFSNEPGNPLFLFPLHHQTSISRRPGCCSVSNVVIRLLLGTVCLPVYHDDFVLRQRDTCLDHAGSHVTQAQFNTIVDWRHAQVVLRGTLSHAVFGGFLRDFTSLNNQPFLSWRLPR